MSIRFTAAALFTTLLLAGCASMSEDQCRRANWYEQGRSDGRDGQNDARIEAHREACAKAGVAPEVERWRAGWREGVRSYCTPQSAWDAGKHDRSYRGACRELDEPAFLRWYRAGKDVYKTRQQRDANRAEIDKLEAQLKKTDKEDERKALRDKLRNLDEEQGRLRRLLENLESGAPR